MKIFKKSKFWIGGFIFTLLPLATVVSCGPSTNIKGSSNLDYDSYQFEKISLDKNNDGVENFAFKGKIINPNKWSVSDVGYGDGNDILPAAIYDGIIDIFQEGKGINVGHETIADKLGVKNLRSLIDNRANAQVIITDNIFHVEFQKWKGNGKKEIDYLRASDTFKIEEVQTQPFGVWMARVKFWDNGDSAQWEHGKSHNSNYQILGYPLYYINTEFANLGVTSQNVGSNQIFQITYNHDA